jgi:hypothetical protein
MPELLKRHGYMSADFVPDESPFHEPTNWPRLYAAAALAGAALGVVVALKLLPAIPSQVTAWLESFESRAVAILVSILCGTFFALALTAMAHLGVILQLRHRSGPRSDKPG